MFRLSQEQKRKRQDMRKILYSLRMRYGVKAELYKYEEGVTFDPETGKSGVATRTQIKLRKFVSWAAMTSEKFEYDLAYVAANKNFTYGGLFEVGDRFAIIDWPGEKLADNFEMDLSFYIVLDGVRYNIKKYEQLDHKAGFIMYLRRINEQLPHQIISRTVQHQLVISNDTIVGVL
jgi:hypothetical protein